jgi:hypothetical protein
MAAAGINPNGYLILSGWVDWFFQLFRPSVPGESQSLVLAEVLEYRPIWYFYTELYYKWPIYLAAFFLISLLALALKYVYRRRVELPEAFVCLLVIFFGTYYARGINFALMMLPFMMGTAMYALSGWKRAIVPVLAVVVMAAMLLDVGRHSPWKLRPVVPTYWIDASYPEGAVSFIKRNAIGGRMFNDLRWGGYLIWRLYPEHKVFIDGRTISSNITGLYLAVIKGTSSSMDILDTFNVNFMVLSVMSAENGVISPLVLNLARDESPRWKLVFIENNAAVFVRDSGQNRGVIQCCSIPVDEVYHEVVAISDFLLSMMPGHHNALLSKAMAFYELKMYSEAKRILVNLPSETVISRGLLERMKDY